MSRLQKLLGVGKGYLERLPPVDVHKLLKSSERCSVLPVKVWA